MPTRSNKAVSRGKLIMEAAILGLMRYLSGSMRMVSRASICSEIRWIPTSAVIAEPALAAIIIAENGAQFPDQRESHQDAERPFRAEFNQGMVRLKAQHHAGEQADERDDHRGPCPDVIDLLNDLRYLLGS